MRSAAQPAVQPSRGPPELPQCSQGPDPGRAQRSRGPVFWARVIPSAAGVRVSVQPVSQDQHSKRRRRRGRSERRRRRGESARTPGCCPRRTGMARPYRSVAYLRRSEEAPECCGRDTTRVEPCPVPCRPCLHFLPYSQWRAWPLLGGPLRHECMGPHRGRSAPAPAPRRVLHHEQGDLNGLRPRNICRQSRDFTLELLDVGRRCSHSIDVPVSSESGPSAPTSEVLR